MDLGGDAVEISLKSTSFNKLSLCESLIGSTALLLFTGALFLQQAIVPQLSPEFRLHSHAWNWLSQLKIDVEYSTRESTQVGQGILQSVDTQQRSAIRVAHAPLARPVSSQLRHRKLPLSKKAFRTFQKLGKSVPIDTLAVSQSAALFDGSIELSESKKFRWMHQVIAARLVIALNGGDPMVVPSSHGHTSLPLARVSSQEHSVKKSKKMGRAIASVSQATEEPAFLVHKNSENVPSSDLLTDEASGVKIEEAIRASRDIRQNISAVVQSSQPVHLERVDLASPSLSHLNEEMNALEFTSLSTHLSLIQKDHEVKRKRMMRKLGPALAYPALLASYGVTTEQGSESELAEVDIHLSTQAHAEVPVQASPNREYDPRGAEESANHLYAEPESSHLSEIVVTAPRYIEAFDAQQTPIEDVLTEAMSREETSRDGKIVRGWQIAQSSGHIDTVSWENLQENLEVDDYSAGQVPTPLISRNTMMGIARLQGVTIQADTGIIFGQLEKGWNVELSGRSEKVWILPGLNSDQFIFLNAEPGSQLIYLTRESLGEKQSGAVPISVLSNAATYVDLAQVQSRTLSGRVKLKSIVDEERKDAISGAIVRVVGQESAVGVTDAAGRFQIEGVLTVGSYPFFVETDKGSGLGSGFTHRYRLSPGRMDRQRLYRFRAREVKEWVKQLPGGIGGNTGIAVVLASKFTSKYPALSLSPHFGALSVSHLRQGSASQSDEKDSSETYTISPGGILEINRPLGDYETSFLGVELPQGPVIAELNQEAGGAQVWSQILPVSPGVLNVVVKN
jgi:hypothetical protein